MSLTIEQLVATAGDGKLLDESECSKEVRAFLSQVQSETLAAYADHCLEVAFPKSGMVLQDIVNELGRRLDYIVTNGRYQGKNNAVGNDGLWRSPEGHAVLVEVKTTDVYRVSLDTIAGYRDQIGQATPVGESTSMLIVVGREDTGELEAQIRGSRHAWDMRLISIEALARLVKLRETTEGTRTGAKIRSVLVPVEYTRLDALVDVLFTAAKDVETTIDAGTPPEDTEETGSTWEFTDPRLMQAKRDEIVAAFAKPIGVKLVRKSRALYWDAEHVVRVVCTVSKRYTKKGATPYWYAYHPTWDQFLVDATKGHFILGCMDLNVAFALPVQTLREHLDELSTTTRADGSSYWHLKILEPTPKSYSLQMPRSGRHLKLDRFVFRLT